jgi:hypothetical protein
MARNGSPTFPAISGGTWWSPEHADGDGYYFENVPKGLYPRRTQRRPVILQVAARDLPSAVRAVLDDETVQAVRDTEAARDPPERPDLVVLDRPSVEGADEFVDWLRSDESPDPKLPLIVLVDTVPPGELPLLAYDEVVHLPTDETAVRAALQTARAVTGYRDAVTDLYDECLSRAEAGNGPLEVDEEVRAARERADERLADLPDDPEVFAALLADPDDGVED